MALRASGSCGRRCRATSRSGSTATVRKEGGSLTQVVCDDTATLAHLAGQACVTPHRRLSHPDRPTRPDRPVFDGMHAVGWVAGGPYAAAAAVTLAVVPGRAAGDG